MLFMIDATSAQYLAHAAIGGAIDGFNERYGFPRFCRVDLGRKVQSNGISKRIDFAAMIFCGKGHRVDLVPDLVVLPLSSRHRKQLKTCT